MCICVFLDIIVTWIRPGARVGDFKKYACAFLTLRIVPPIMLYYIINQIDRKLYSLCCAHGGRGGALPPAGAAPLDGCREGRVKYCS